MVLKAPEVPGSVLDAQNAQVVQPGLLPSRRQRVKVKEEVRSPRGSIREAVRLGEKDSPGKRGGNWTCRETGGKCKH